MSWAGDGELAIASLASGKFDLFYATCTWRVDGFSVLLWQREGGEVSDMKVIVLTADDAVRAETMALGADAFLTKPLDLKQLSAAIKVVTGIAAGCNGSPSEAE